MRSFASDNNAGIHPAVLQAIADANVDHAVGYGGDPWTKRAVNLFEREFGPSIEVHFVWNSTGANVLALALTTQSYQAVLCAESAHINVDETGAPERFVGCKLIDLPTTDGKLTVDLLCRNLRGLGSMHHVQPKVVSITQANELGLVYTVAEIHALGELCREHGFYLHVDGARLANAAVALDVPYRRFTRDCGVDVLTFGGTKNGLLCGEAVVVFNRELFGRAQYLRKQATQLASKMRFIAAQFSALLTDDLGLRNAGHANAMARRLADKVAQVRGVEIVRPVETNAVFARLAKSALDELLKNQFFYIWDEHTSEVRWVTSFDTTPVDIDAFVAALAAALGEPAT